MTFPLKIPGLLKSKGGGDSAFTFTINTALGTGDTMQLPLPSGETYNFVVNWGDTNEDTITAYNQAETLHTYSSGGIYQITITGKCGGWSFNNVGDKLKITSTDNWGDPEFDNMVGGFYGCSNLASLAIDGIKGSSITLARVFQNCSSLTTISGNLFSTDSNSFFNIFANCTSLSALPSGIFDSILTATDFSQLMFGCTSLASLPVDLFKNNTQLAQIRNGFVTCTSLTSLPEDLFYYNSSITNYQNCFQNCRNIVLPTRLFNTSNLSIVTAFDRFMSALSTSYSYTGTIQDVWTYATSATSVDAFKNQTLMTNYASIPNGWKGL